MTARHTGGGGDGADTDSEHVPLTCDTHPDLQGPYRLVSRDDIYNTDTDARGATIHPVTDVDELLTDDSDDIDDTVEDAGVGDEVFDYPPRVIELRAEPPRSTFLVYVTPSSQPATYDIRYFDAETGQQYARRIDPGQTTDLAVFEDAWPTVYATLTEVSPAKLTDRLRKVAARVTSRQTPVRLRFMPAPPADAEPNS
jgi:hypothetical protein